MSFASKIGIRRKTPEQNWISNEDVDGFLKLSDFEPVMRQHKVLMPLGIPGIEALLNRLLAPLPFFEMFTLANVLVARPIGFPQEKQRPSFSVVVPLRNEAGNIENILRGMPTVSEADELIFVEGHSTDDTWEVLQKAVAEYRGPWRTQIFQQTGKGKGDAVRCGFEHASGDILAILDADLTVAPEELPKFYDVIVSGKGEFINGSRLVYPREKRAMRFANLVGNKFFAIAFSFVLGQRLKDTLCGTKVLSRKNYENLVANRAYFGDFDPFGDFDLIFGASKLGLGIVELPVRYRERVYGTTNIERWRHGVILLRMLLFAAAKIRFV